MDLEFWIKCLNVASAVWKQSDVLAVVCAILNVRMWDDNGSCSFSHLKENLRFLATLPTLGPWWTLGRPNWRPVASKWMGIGTTASLINTLVVSELFLNFLNSDLRWFTFPSFPECQLIRARAWNCAHYPLNAQPFLRICNFHQRQWAWE